MSGICGICNSQAAGTGMMLEAMLSALLLPGESDHDRTVDQSIGMAVARRWPSQETAEFSDIRVAVDADLCDVAEIRAELSGNGLDASRMSLGELLAGLYRARGLSFVKRLHGPFSFALWDETARRLVVGIDRLGVKNLYWCLEKDRFLFASRPSAVAAGRPGSPTVNSAAIVQYLIFSAVPAPLSVYAGVERLPPGSLLVYQDGRVEQQQYWRLEYREGDTRDVNGWAREVEHELRAAVHRQMQGLKRNESGAYLSGGTDSSSVVAFMTEKQAPVNTFSISFQEQKYNEIDYARTTAQWFSSCHYEKCVSAQDAAEAIPQLIRYYDEPFANSSAIGAYHCALLAREKGVNTLLAGDGGDELFAGNERYASDKRFALYHGVPAWLRRGVIEPISNVLPNHNSWLSLPQRYIRRAYIQNPRRVFSYNLFLSSDPKEIFEDGVLADYPPERWMEIAEKHFSEVIACTELNRLLHLDVKITLGDNDLRKVSGTAELAGVQVRFPLVDYKLAEFAATIPSNLKLRGFEKRFIFRRAMKGILPSKVLHKRKHGFGVPLGLWLLKEPHLNSLMHDVLSDSRTRQRGYFRNSFLDKLRDLHRTGHAGFYGESIWYVLVLELWHREHVERQRGAGIAK